MVRVTRCLFVSDLHGRPDRYEKLLAAVEAERPGAVFLGGDLLPLGALSPSGGDFLLEWLGPRLEALRSRLGPQYPRVLAVFGNDDPRAEEESLAELERRGLLEHAHGRRIASAGVPVYGYACVPPTPFTLKDWERYDVSRFVDPGCVVAGGGVPLGGGARGRHAGGGRSRGDLEALVGAADVSTRGLPLPLAALRDGPRPRGARRAGPWTTSPSTCTSAASRSGASSRRASRWLTLHGHVHESARLTGAWQDRIGRTVCLSAAHDGPELALVRFDLDRPARPPRLRARLVEACHPRTVAGASERRRSCVAESRMTASERSRSATVGAAAEASGRAASVTAPILAAKLLAAGDVRVRHVVDVEEPLGPVAGAQVVRPRPGTGSSRRARARARAGGRRRPRRGAAGRCRWPARRCRSSCEPNT